MPALSPHLLIAAKRFSLAISKTDCHSILMGGAASILLGCPDRSTKDLDFNLSLFHPKIHTALKAAGISVRQLALQNRLKATVPESEPGRHDAASIDIAIKPEVISLLQYTKILDGIRVADERLILVDKIRCFSGRSDSSDKKIGSDLKDILFCISRMEEEKTLNALPVMLKEQLSQNIWFNFWARLKDRTTVDDYGIFVESFKTIFG